jgi:hypothetical protein
MRTRRSWRNQARLFKAIGHDLARAAAKSGAPKTPAVPCHCAINADGSPDLPYDADCPVHGETAHPLTIYDQLVAAGVPLDSHESDLYAKLTEASTAIIRAYPSRDNVRTFVHQVDHTVWYDIPFAYLPFWEARQK